MSDKTFRQASREEWVNLQSGNPSAEQIATGALQRIADATEAMAKNWSQIVAERDRYERYYRQELASGQRLARSNAALRGVIGRLKRAKAPLGKGVIQK